MHQFHTLHHLVCIGLLCLRDGSTRGYQLPLATASVSKFLNKDINCLRKALLTWLSQIK